MTKPTMPVVYVSGPYRSKHGENGVWENIMQARRVTLELLRLGVAPICPHLNTLLMGGGLSPDPAKELEIFLAADFEIIRRCDAIFLLDGWELSQGASREADVAAQHGLTLFTLLDDVVAWRIAGGVGQSS